MPDMRPVQHDKNAIQFTALFDSSVKWRVMDEFSPEQLHVEEDGRLLLAGKYSDIQSLVRWLLSFGNQVQLVSPTEARELLLLTAKKIIQNY